MFSFIYMSSAMFFIMLEHHVYFYFNLEGCSSAVGAESINYSPLVFILSCAQVLVNYSYVFLPAPPHAF